MRRPGRRPPPESAAAAAAGRRAQAEVNRGFAVADEDASGLLNELEFRMSEN